MTYARTSEKLLTANKLTIQDVLDILTRLSEKRLDYGDVYFKSSSYEVWSLDERIIKTGHYEIDQGVGIRAIVGEKTGFAYTDDITLALLHESATAASSIVREAGGRSPIQLHATTPIPLYTGDDPLFSLPNAEKIALLHRVDRLARELDPRVIEVQASLSGEYDYVLIAATDGTLSTDIRPLVRLSVSVLVEQDGRRENGSSGGGGRLGYEHFLSLDANGDVIADRYVQEAVRIAITNLSAIAAPAGTMPVVLGAGWSGVLLHEAVGHGLEGDFNRKNTSVFSGKIGQKVTSALCTIVDDGSLEHRRGSLTIDDEGVPGQKNILIENGILKKYMQDKLNARLMGMAPTGNGRRENYNSLPMPRMTNTYMLAGTSTQEEIIASVDSGIYITQLAGGQVDITSGNFVFSTAEAYLIEKGKKTTPIKGATLIGSGIETMNQIVMVGNDLSLDSGVGICGKAGQSVPVGVGQPTVKIEQITVGGTAE